MSANMAGAEKTHPIEGHVIDARVPHERGADERGTGGREIDAGESILDVHSSGATVPAEQRRPIQFDELLKLTRDKSKAGRHALLNMFGDLFQGNANALSEQERTMMSDILRHLVKQVEQPVRRLLAERLASSHNAPPALVKQLANDSIEVAHPILQHSTILHDTDLVEIIQQRSLQHRLAIAMRQDLNEEVTDALAETGEEAVIRSLLENQDARISQATMGYLAEQAKTVDSFQNPMLSRRDVTPQIAAKLYWWVSAALRQDILARFEMDPADLDELLAETVGEIVSMNEDHGGGTTHGEEIAARLQATGALTPQLMVQTLRQGEVALFEAMFAAAAKIRLVLVRRFLFELGGEGLAIACRAMGIEKPIFASIFLLSRKARPGDQMVDPMELSRVLAFFEDLEVEAAQKVMKRWRLDPNYLEAQLKIEEKMTGLN